MTLIQLASWHFGRRVPAQVFWAGAYLAAFLTAINLLTRSEQPGIAAVFGLQVTQFLTTYLMLMGTRCYLGLKPWSLRDGTLILAGLLLATTYFTVFDPNPALRIAVSSLVTGVLFGLCATTMARGGIRQYPARYIFAIPCSIHAIFVLGRLALIYRNHDKAADFVQSATIPSFLILESIVSLVIIAFATLMLISESMTNELRKLAELDPLTNTFNRRSFLNLLDKAESSANRRQTPLSILLIDLDHFKQINDTHGHARGDEALCHFVKLATACLRNEDVLGRIGGEEFAAFLPDAAMADARLIAERLRAHIAAHPFAGTQGPIPLTISIGIAQCQSGETIETALHRADAAMYRAKENGRNRIESWQLGNAV